MTHAELVKRAERWLRSLRFPVILADVQAVCVREQPDVIGWMTDGGSALIECKASRADFLRDAAKSFRRLPAQGMGRHRWFLAPEKVAETIARDIADREAKSQDARWGVLGAVGPASVRVLRKATPFYARNEVDERRLLVSAVRRATEGWGRRMFGDIAPAVGSDGDPHPSTARLMRELREENARLRTMLQSAARMG